MQPTLITIDGGNTNLSVGLHYGEDSFEKLSWNEYLANYPSPIETPAVYSAVRTYSEVHRDRFLNLKHIPNFKGGSFFEMPVHYSETIGIDRLVGAYYCWTQYFNESNSKKRIAFIDAGTFITIDFLSADGLLGGYIFPGMQILRQTYLSGERLAAPPLKLSDKYTELPHTTEEAIHRAYSWLIHSLKQLVGDQFTYITGGNCEEMAPLFPNHSLDKELQHRAIRHIATQHL